MSSAQNMCYSSWWHTRGYLDSLGFFSSLEKLWAVLTGNRWHLTSWLVNLPPPNVPTPEINGNKALSRACYCIHWFPLIRPAIKPLLRAGVVRGRGGKASVVVRHIFLGARQPTDLPTPKAANAPSALPAKANSSPCRSRQAFGKDRSSHGEKTRHIESCSQWI